MGTEERISYIRHERDSKENRKDQLLTAHEEATLRVCVSLDFNDRMSDKVRSTMRVWPIAFVSQELNSLARQLGYAYKLLLTHESYKASLLVTSYSEEDMKDHVSHFAIATWECMTRTSHVLELYEDRLDRLVVLSPDADEVLMEEEILDSSRIFVIGGLVDRTVSKNETRAFGRRNNLALRRLPIREVLGSKVHPVLNINTVFEILCAIHFDGVSMKEALDTLIPQRKHKGTEPRRHAS
eukprot:Blabericola_migrator_1__9441@NODE_510_length_7944_cov_147_881554_g391_i0_p5_GENE_NODE_510_length_7944_cov_147_881554_g391_i0NODE_510_length_7944_cov_147_881554_g391_i0_p5_ORF_typecomplete_len240_score45_60tRNA_m1G_MT/PF01746_21/9_7e12RNA_Me_trans/PF04252_13/5_3e09_NODE_510_length_7944_cov_147_881554_g391_i062957014